MDENDITKKSNDITSSSSVLSKLFKALDENGRYLQYCAYGTALAGIILITRSIRLGTKFTNSAGIPREFYEKNVNLYGLVQAVEVKTGILSVEHKSIISGTSFKHKKIPSNHETKEAGNVNVNGLLKLQMVGLEFKSEVDSIKKLESKILNQNIKFTLIDYNEPNQAAFCLIFSKGYFFMRNFGVWCIKNDVGVLNSTKLLRELPSNMWKNKRFSIYYNKILKQQAKKENPSFFRVFLSKVKSIISKFRTRRHPK